MNFKPICAALTLCAAVLSFGLGAQAHAEPQTQSSQAGLRMMTVPGPEPVQVALFYPSTSRAFEMNMGPFAPKVAMNGNPVASLKGLILLSHGAGGSELGHYNLAQALAQHGYLVAAPRHPRDNWTDRSLIATPVYFSERPRQLSRVLDALLNDPEWKDRIAPGRIGAIGHSAGGYSVLALAGGVANPARLVAHCGPESDDPGFCAFGARRAGAGYADAADSAGFEVIDKRIRAVVAMAPVGAVFAPESLARIGVPVRIYAAEQDAVLKAKYHGAFLHAGIPHAEYVQVKNAGHFAFMAPMNMVVNTAGGNPNADPAGFDRAAFHLELEQEVVAFFGRHLQ